MNALADVLVILIPLQMIVWPLIYLAQWPPSVVAAVAALYVVWVFLMGGVLSIALAGAPVHQPRDPALLTRSLWMLLLVVIVLAAPAAMLTFSGGGRPGGPPAWLPMLSLLSAISDITGQGIAGPQRPVSPLQWRLIAITGGIAAAVWAVGGLRANFVSKPDPA